MSIQDNQIKMKHTYCDTINPITLIFYSYLLQL